MLSRRALLAVGTAALAGCNTGSPRTTGTASDTPTRTPRSDRSDPSATPRPTPGSRDSFAAYLDRRSVRVRALDRENERVTLRYVSAGDSDRLSAEIGTVAGGFLREVEEGWGVSRLDATIVTSEDEPLARWHVRSAWLEQYRTGEISGSELSLKVLDSLERVE